MKSDEPPSVRIVNRAPNFGFQGVAYAPVTIHQYPEFKGPVYTEEEIKEGKARLACLPTDSVPDPSPLPAGSRMPLLTNTVFTGREHMFLDLARALVADPEKEGRAIVICGIGGIGKTQLASEVAHRYGQFFAGGVIWIRFSEKESIPDQVIASANLAPPRPDFGQLSRDEQVAAVAAAWESGLPRLLLFDNCEDEPLLMDWLPRTGESRVLVTAQKANWSSGIRVLELNELQRRESIALLRRLSGAESEHFNAIAEELGDLPLALFLAGSFLHAYPHSPAGSPGAYLRQLRESPILEHPSMTGRVAGALPTQHDKRIGHTFELSFRGLDSEQPADRMALALLGRSSFLAPGLPIPRDFLLSTLPPAGEADLEQTLLREDAIRRARDVGLMQEQADGAVYLHRLVAAHVRRKQAGSEARGPVEAGMLRVFAHSRHLRSAVDRSPLRDHLRHVADAAITDRTGNAAALANALALDLNTAADHEGYAVYAEHALRIAEAESGRDQPPTALYLNNFGHALLRLERASEARTYFERALPLWKTLGDYANAGATMDNLGSCFIRMGDYRSSIEWHRAALELRESAQGPDDPDVAISAYGIAYTYQEQGDYASAEPFYQRALEIRRKNFQGPHMQTAVSLTGLGHLYALQNRYAEALPLLAEAADMKEAVYGRSHSSFALTIGLLAQVHACLGDTAEAERQLARIPSASGQGAQAAMNVFNAIGLAWWRKRQYTAAWLAYHRAESYLNDEKIRDTESAGILSNNIGMLLISEGRLEEAGRWIERALDIQSKLTRQRSADLWARYLNNYGKLLRLRGDLKEAREYLTESLRLRSALLGEASADTAMTLHELGLVLMAEGNGPEAEDWLRRALAARRAALGVDHEETLRTLDDLNGCLTRQGKRTESS